MIERVAKALFNAEYGDGRHWEDAASEARAYWTAQARAAIEAMLNLDEVMLCRAAEMMPGLRYEESYRRMINTALGN